MKLIKELGIKLNTDNRTATFGLFECPICNDQIERVMSKGKRNKSCGKKECRKEAGNFKGWAGPLSEDKPYYKTIINRIKELGGCKNNREIYEHIIEEYKVQRSQHKRVSIIKIDETRPIETGNLQVVTLKEKKQLINKQRLNDQLKDIGYTTVHVAQNIGVTHAFVLRSLLTKYDKTNNIDTNTRKIYDISSGSKSYKAYSLTDKEYEELLIIYKHIGNRKKSNNLYLIKMLNSYKIGVASDLEKRFKSINASSPLELEIINTWEVSNARELEKYLHTKYKKNNIKFEWFSLIKEEIKELQNIVEVTLNKETKEWCKPSSDINLHPVDKRTRISEEDKIINNKPNYDHVIEKPIPGTRAKYTPLVKDIIDPIYQKMWNSLKVQVGGAKYLNKAYNTREKMIELVKDQIKDMTSKHPNERLAIKRDGDKLLIKLQKQASITTKQVVRKIDGKEWDSIRQVVDTEDVSASGLKRALKSGKEYKGSIWLYKN